VVTPLLAEGADRLNQFAGNGNTGDVRHLLDLGVPITSLYNNGGLYFGIPRGSTALYTAAWFLRHATVKVLVKGGALVNVQDGAGRTPLISLVDTSDPPPNCGCALLRRNSDEIMLNTQFEDDDRPAAPDGPRQKAHNDTCFYVGCNDLDAAYAHLQANGVAAQKPSVARYGMRQLYFADPDGFNLRFQHPVSEKTVEQWQQWYGAEPR
jgi:hypothetical protein